MKRFGIPLVIILTMVVTACSHGSQVADVPVLQQEADTWPRCVSGCTANDVEIRGVWLDIPAGNYTLGETVTHNVSMDLYFHRQNTYCIIVVADLYEGGVLQQADWVSNIIGYHGGSGNYTYSMGTVNWTYGTLFEMRNVLVEWSQNDPKGPCPTDCSNYVNSKCTQVATFVVTTPLVVDFEFNEVCFCNDTTFTDKTTGGVEPYTWYWDFADGDSSTAQNATHHFDSAGNYSVTLNVTDSDSPPAVAHQSYNVTVNAKPTADAGSDQPISSCGGSVGIGGSPTGSGGTPPYTYNWTPTAGLNDPTIANPTASAGGNYTVMVTDDNGCWAEDTVEVTVTGAPTADAGPDQDVCLGGSVVIGGTPTASGGTSPYSYNWTPTTGLDNPAIANPTASPSSTTIYSVVVTDNGGCQAVDQVHVTVHAPTCHISVSPDDSVCQGTTVTLTEDGGDAVSWSWSTGASTQSIQVTSNGTYNVTITDAYGCQSSCQISVTVYDGPTADAGADKQILCGAGSVLIGGSPTASGGTSPYTYLWNPNTGLNDTAIANPSASAAGTFTVTVTDSNGCQDIDSVTVTVIGGPIANAGIDAVFCAGGSVQLSGSASGGISPYTYDWTGPENHPNTQNATVSTAGNYTLTVTDNNGCSDTDGVIVSQYSSPTADAGADSVIISGNSVVIGGTPTASGGTPLYGYSWTPSTGLDNASFANPIASPVVNTTYTVTIIDSNGCTDTDAVTVTVTGATPTCTKIFGYKWGDVSHDGQWDPGEPPLDGWTITLTLPDGSTLDAVTGDGVWEDGYYEFEVCELGSYELSETLLTVDWNQMFPPSPGIHPVEVTDLEQEGYGPYNFGNAQTCRTIYGYIWHDKDEDGVWDAGELPLDSWTTNLVGAQSPINETAITGDGAWDAGYYEFIVCDIADNFTLSEGSQSTWYQTFPLGPGTHEVEVDTFHDGAGVDGPFNFGNSHNSTHNSTVGFQIYQVNRLAIMAPWIALFAAISAGTSFLLLRRRRV